MYTILVIFHPTIVGPYSIAVMSFQFIAEELTENREPELYRRSDFLERTLYPSWTYSELNRRANQPAQSLRKLGVGPKVLVGICMERSLEMVVGL